MSSLCNNVHVPAMEVGKEILANLEYVPTDRAVLLFAAMFVISNSLFGTVCTDGNILTKTEVYM